MRKNRAAEMGAILRRVVDKCCQREGLTQADVARRAGLSPQSLNRSFHTQTGGAALLAVCEAFDLHVEVLPNK